MALLKAIDVDSIVKQAYFGRGTKALQVYPVNQMAAQYAKQEISFDTSALKDAIKSASGSEKTITIGYDSSQPDNQIVSNLISAELAPLGLTVKVQSYPTSQIFGWIGNPKGAPDLLATLGWPDAPSPYTWAHISFDATGGLNYLHCSSDEATKTIAKALSSGKDQDYSDAAQQASDTGCWLQHGQRHRLHGGAALAEGCRGGSHRLQPQHADPRQALGRLMGSGVRRIILLTLGWEDLPKAVSVYGSPPEMRMREPVPGVLLECDGGWMLLDTGFNTALIRDPALYKRFYPSVEYLPILMTDGEPIAEALDEVGVDIDSIYSVALSHLHHDHSGGLKLFAGRVPVHAQQRELDYGMLNGPGPEKHAMARIDYDDPRIDWRLASGEEVIAPGVTAIPTYGHTPGHQSFMSSSTSQWAGEGMCLPSMLLT